MVTWKLSWSRPTAPPSMLAAASPILVALRAAISRSQQHQRQRDLLEPAGTWWIFALALSPDGNTLYAGGDLNMIGGSSRSYIGAVDTTSGLATSGIRHGTNQWIYSLAASPDGQAVLTWAAASESAARHATRSPNSTPQTECGYRLGPGCERAAHYSRCIVR